MALDRPLAAVPARGRFFETSWPVRTGDIDAAKRLRLDGIARYLQDAGLDNLDAVDAADSHPLWIVRRTVIDVVRPAVWPERVHLRRWCSALSTRWTNMRVQIEGEAGALIETEGFWIHISGETGMPTRIDDGFIERLGESAEEHRLKWKRWLVENAPAAEEDGIVDTEFVYAAPTSTRSTTSTTPSTGRPSKNCSPTTSIRAAVASSTIPIAPCSNTFRPSCRPTGSSCVRGGTRRR